MATLHLTLLGGFSARIEPGAWLPVSTRKAQALLAFLALPVGRVHSRDKLVSLFWGEVRESQGRASLRQAIFGLKRATAPAHALMLDANAVSLDARNVVVDAVRFQELVDEGSPGALEEAAALYEGDLLTGVALREPAFEDWLAGERERLRELAMDALARLLVHRRDAGALEPAIQIAQRLLALDPLQEPVHRTLMRLYSQAGRQAAALRQYQMCVAALERELRAEPEAETKALYQKILRERSAPRLERAEPEAPRTVTFTAQAQEIAGTETPLIGRDREMADLDAILDRTWAGDGVVVGVEGEAGIGKTRVAAEVAARAAARGGRVLLGHCYETEQSLPYGPWLDALRAASVAKEESLLGELGAIWRAELAYLLPDAAGGDVPVAGGGEPARVFEALARLLERVAARQPLVIVIDDLQWADETSVRLAAFLGRRLVRKHVLLFLTARVEDTRQLSLLHQMREELRRVGRIVQVALPPLSREATMTLARALQPRAQPNVDRLEEAIWRHSEGSPFMIVEILRELEDRTGQFAAGGLPLPARVRELVGQRLARLSEHGRRLAETAAVIGRQFEFRLLWRAAEVAEDEAAAGVEELVRGRVLHQAGEGFEFVHDRVREVAYGGLLAPRRVILHRRVAEALEAIHAGDLDRHALAVGTHHHAAGAAERAADFLGRAAVAALGRGAAREALACCEQALTGLQGEAPDVVRHRSDLHLQGGHAHFWMGELEQAMVRYRKAEAEAQTLGDDDRLARVGVALTRLLGADARHREAVETGERSLALATALADRSLEVWARTGLCAAHFARADYRRVIAHARAALEVLPGTRIGERPAAAGVLPEVSALGWWAQSAARLGDFEDGLTRARDALAVAEAQRHHPACAFARYSLGHLYLARGNFSDALAVLEPAVELALIPIRPRILAALASVHARTGRLDRAETLIEQAIETALTVRFLYGHSVTLIHRAVVHLLAGRLDAAAAGIDQVLAVTRERGQGGDEGWALLIAGEVAARSEPGAPRAGNAWCEALTRAEALEMRPLAARCHLSLGNAALRAGETDAGRTELTVAAQAFREMGMTHWQEEAERLLRMTTGEPYELIVPATPTS